MPCPASHPLPAPCPGQPAFTLLEVILAMAILAGSVVTLGEVLRLADRNGADAQAETQAQLMASTLMDEMAAGLVEIREKNREPLDTGGVVRWFVSVTLSSVHVSDSLEGLISVDVVVEQDLKKAFRPVKYRLLRWLYLAPESAGENSSDDSEDTRQSDSNTNSGEGSDG